jgi:hypothetical protein
MKIYNENGKLIDGYWLTCKAIVLEYDKVNPFEHETICENTVKHLATKYDVAYDDVVTTVELLSGLEL